MTFCLDTDIIIDYLKDSALVVKRVHSQLGKISTTPITASELYYGAYRSNQIERRRKEVEELLLLFEVLPFTPAVYELFGKIKAELKEKGEPLDNFDLLIASFCIAHHQTLVTNNLKHFSRIQGLHVENWK